MYTLIASKSLSKDPYATWSNDSLSTVLLKSLFDNYLKVYLTLSIDTSNQIYYVDLESLRLQHYFFSGTLSDFLTFNANNTLPYISAIPVDNQPYVKYYEAVSNGYKFGFATYGLGSSDLYPLENMPDLVAHRPYYTTDMSTLESTCLVSINGYFHKTIYENSVLYLLNGGRTARKSNHCHVGFHCFKDVCEISKHQAANIAFEQPDSGLRKKVYFTIDNSDIDKSFFLILGGYLLFPETDVFYPVGVNRFVVDLNQIPFIERIAESMLYLDYTEFDLTQHVVNQELLNMSEINSDVFLTKYFTSNNTFFVQTNKDRLVTSRVVIKNSNIPGGFTSYQKPDMPLISNYGKVTEYLKSCSGGTYTLKVVDTFYRNYVFSHQQYQSLVNVTDQLLPNLPYYNSHGYLLKITSFNTQP